MQNPGCPNCSNLQFRDGNLHLLGRLGLMESLRYEFRNGGRTAQSARMISRLLSSIETNSNP